MGTLFKLLREEPSDPGLHCLPVLDLGLISIASLGPRASTKVESHAIFTESRKV